MPDEHRAHRDSDRIIVSGKDIGLITAIFVLTGIIISIARHPLQWDATVAKVAVLEPIVYQTKTRQDVLESQLSNIAENIREIKSDMKDIKRSYR